MMAPSNEADSALAVQRDRDRIAAGLQDQVVRQIFAAGLALQGASGLSTQPEVRRRIDEAIADLDDAVRTIRDTVFGLEHRLVGHGLREEILSLLGQVAPGSEISFSGPVDGALAPGAGAVLVDMVREALDLIGPYLVPTRVAVSADCSSHVIAVEAVPTAGRAGEPECEFRSLQDWAVHAGMRLDIQPGTEFTRFVWSFPFGSAASA